MRLIDADLLEPDADYDDGEFWAVSMGQIQDAPTIEPKRETGEWITHYYKLGTERYECNVCHNRIGDTPYYCPNCGARMVQEGEDNDS